MSILDVILSAQGGGAVRQIGNQFGLDESQTQSAIAALLPALAGAVNQNAGSGGGGLDALLGALQGGNHARYLDDPSTLSDPGTTQDGNNILGHLFGSKEVSREVASRASAQTGIGADILKQLLPVVATMVMGGLAKRASAGGMFGGGATAPSAGFNAGGAPASAGGGLLDMLAPMLDRNRDGSALDDVLGMAASFLTRR